MKRGTTKTHNRPSATDAKVDLRTRVLWHVKPARVLDCFCGPEGEMYKRAWHQASHYVGIDEEWNPDDPRLRFVGDNVRVLRTIDLSEYNVFDLDAFGSPWEQAIIIAARRPWAKGERGALVITDGSGKQAQFGALAKGMAELLGMARRTGLAPAGNKEGLSRMALRAWARRANVKPVHEWQAYSAHGAKGSMPMVYAALVFEGMGTRVPMGGRKGRQA